MAKYSSWDSIELKFPLSQDYLGIMEQIAKSASAHRLVGIQYRAKKDDFISQRVIEPYEFKEGKLYGYDVAKQGIRAFILTNIQAAVATDQPFEPRFPVLISSPYSGDIGS